jgi:hypothetical protein
MERELKGIKEMSGQRWQLSLLSDDSELGFVGLEMPSFRGWSQRV